MRSATMLLAVAALGTAAPAFPKKALDPAVQEGVQVGVGRCLFVVPRTDEGRDRFLSAFAAAAITKGVNLLGTALTKAGAAKTWKEQRSRNFQAKAGEFPDCVQVVRGRFYRTRATVAPLSGSLASKQSELNANGLYLAGDPDFLLELRFVAAGDGQALALRPIKTIFNRPMGTRALRGSDRSFAAFLAITTPGQPPSLETAPAATIVIGRLSPGSDIDYVDPADVSSPYESSWFTFTPGDQRKPLTLTALVTETQDEDRFLTFVGGVLGDEETKKDLSSAIQAIVIPSAGRDQEYARETGARTAESLADEKFGTALGKLLACKSSDAAGASDAAVAARRALLDFLTADQDPKLTRPRNLVTQADVNSIDPRRVGEAPQRCGAVYDKLVQ